VPRKKKDADSGVRLIESVIEQYRQEWDEESQGDFDEGAIASDAMCVLSAEGYDAQTAREVAVRMLGWVPMELAESFNMRPSLEDVQF
jgi:hypothetical protein